METGTVRRMRWEELFDDIEAQFDEQERVAAATDLVDLVRGERDQVGVVDRLRAHVNAVLALDLRDGSNRRGTFSTSGGTGCCWKGVPVYWSRRVPSCLSVVSPGRPQG